MDIFLKKELYFRISIEDGSDRQLVVDSFNKTIEPAFEEFIRKTKFDKKEVDALYELTNKRVELQILPKRDFVKLTNSKDWCFILAIAVFHYLEVALSESFLSKGDIVESRRDSRDHRNQSLET